jgi:hypothetical protein
MPSTYHVDPEQELILVRPTGRFTETAFIQLCRALYDDPDREPSFSVIWDTRDIDELVMDADVIPEYKTFLRENEDRLTQGPIAIIADRALTKTFASMITQVGNELVGACEIVSTPDEAAQWLDIPNSALSDLPTPRRVDV